VSHLLEIVGVLVIGYSIVLNLTFTLFTVLAWQRIRFHHNGEDSLTTDEMFRSPLTPPVTVILPAFNEEAGVVESVRSLLQLRYPELEIVVVDDGSKDRTVEVLRAAFDLVPVRRVMRDELKTAPIRQILVSRTNPNLSVVSKDNGGKADALNCGVNLARYPYVCAIDADAILEEQALLRVMAPIVDDPEVVAAGGIVRIVNGCTVHNGRVIDVSLPTTRLATLQVVEYLRAFLVGRMGWASVGALLIVSGAFGVFKRSVVVGIGGYETGTVGEDMELVVRIHRTMRREGRRYKVQFVPDPVCWTEAPESIRILSRQRRRWQRGLLETLSTHKRAVIEARQGVFGRFAIPYFILFEALGPLVEVIGYLTLPYAALTGRLAWEYALAFYLISVGWGMLLSVAAVALEELTYRRYPLRRHVARLALYSVVDNLGYRQLTSFWRLWGIVEFVRKEKSWGTMDRKGFTPAASEPVEEVPALAGNTIEPVTAADR
jgi:cellulose synthase/poly-beta-1,6-N-acetylglucosamine synthase-like glycosyltransferase